MSTFTITNVHDKVRDWSSQQGGAMKAYRIDVTGPRGEENGVEWSRKASSEVPTVGQTIDGDIEQGQYGPKFKAARQASGFGGPRQRDPKETAAIQRQHSQSAAVEFLKAKIQAGALEGDFPSMDNFRWLVDWFQRDIEWGVRLASAPEYGREWKAKDQQRTGGTDVPAEPDQFVHLPDDGAGTPFSVRD